MGFGRFFPWIATARRLAAILACAFLLAGCEIRFGSPVSLFDDERAVATAISAMKSHYKGPVRANKLLIASDHVILQALDPRGLQQLVEFRMERQYHPYFSLDRVVGPYPVQNQLTPISRRFEHNLFNLDEIDLSGWDKLADAAIARAALKDKSGVASIEVSRPSGALPNIAIGAAIPKAVPVRWTIEVKNLTETVLVYADAKGEVTGVNLHGTDRMRNLNMYQRPDLAAEAAAEVRRQAGNQPILLRVSFYSTMIGFVTTLKDDSYPIASMNAHAVYNWSFNGLQRGTGSLASSSSNPDAPFGVDEVDWGLLPKIIADARTKLAMPSGRVTSINVKKPSDSVGTPVPIWSVTIEQSGERGEYYADVNGAMKTVSLPPSRRKPANWLEPGAIADALGRIVQEFSPDSKFEEIRFYDSYVKIDAQDPRKPGELMQVNLREQGFSRWGSVMFPKRREDDFPLQDLRLAKENIPAMLERTLTELNMPAGRFTDVIIGRHNAEKSRSKGLTVQIRAEARGVGAGYVVYEADGSVIKAVRLGRP